MNKSITIVVLVLVVKGLLFSSCSSLKSYSNSAKEEVSKLELPPNVSSNKLSKKRLKY